MSNIATASYVGIMSAPVPFPSHPLREAAPTSTARTVTNALMRRSDIPAFTVTPLPAQISY